MRYCKGCSSGFLSFVLSAHGPFFLDPLFQILLLAVEMFSYKILLFFLAGLTFLNDFFNFGVRVKLQFFELLKSFLLFDDQSAGVSFECFSNRWFSKKSLYFFLIEHILFGSSFRVELDSFLSSR